MIADEETTLLIKRTFKASAEDVFDAWLTLERWQSDSAVSTMPSIPPRAAASHDTFSRLPEPATSSQTEVAQRPRGQRRLERRPAYFWSAERTWLKEDNDA
jgi:hypothetical protein